jgi:hypothetical protein
MAYRKPSADSKRSVSDERKPRPAMNEGFLDVDLVSTARRLARRTLASARPMEGEAIEAVPQGSPARSREEERIR